MPRRLDVLDETKGRMIAGKVYMNHGPRSSPLLDLANSFLNSLSNECSISMRGPLVMICFYAITIYHNLASLSLFNLLFLLKRCIFTKKYLMMSKVKQKRIFDCPIEIIEFFVEHLRIIN